VEEVIHLRFEYRCDFCDAEIVGAETYKHGADFGRYPVPRHVTRIGPHHACITCEKFALTALATDKQEREAQDRAEAALDKFLSDHVELRLVGE
jgi:hypothetical protein